MPESQRLHEIRQKIRDWMQEPLTEGDSKYGKEFQAEMHNYWPELFKDNPERPATNYDALTVAGLYLGEAAGFIRESDDDVSIEQQAKLLDVDKGTMEIRRNDTLLAHKNIVALQSSIAALAGTDELLFSDTEKHLSNAKLGSKVMRKAEEVIRGGLSMGQVYDQPEKAALINALDHAIINFNHMKLRQAIEGKGRSLGDDPEQPS